MAAPYCAYNDDSELRSSASLLCRPPREKTPAMAAPFYCRSSNGDDACTLSASAVASLFLLISLSLGLSPFGFISDGDGVLACAGGAILKAAVDGNLDRLKGILKNITEGNGDPSAIFSFNMGGVGVLHVAACAGHLNICKYLVEELGGDVNAPGCGARAQGATPFMKAAQSGSVPVIKYFLEHGGDLMKTDDKGRTVLHHAAGTGSCEVTAFLLSKGMPVDLDCGRGTPLLMAAINEQDKTLKILLDHQANPNNITIGAGVPLCAIIYRSLKCAKLLIKAGANVNCKGSLITPLVFATMQGGYTKFIKLLLKAGADPNIADDLGRLPIELAAERDCKEEVEMLLPVTTPIPNAPDWSIEGLISHAKIKDKNTIGWRQEEGGKSMDHVTSESAQIETSPRMESDYIQIFVEFGQCKTAVDAKPKNTVREVISSASNNLGVIIKDYYIVYSSKCLKLDGNLLSQNIFYGSFLIPRFRLRGGMSQWITWKQPLVDYTHGFGDELFDLCHIPGFSTSVCLDRPGTTICCKLTEMIRRLFEKGLCAPNFKSSDITFDHNNGTFDFRSDFRDFKSVTMKRFASSMACLSLVIRRTFYFSPAKVLRGEPVIRVLAHGDDEDNVVGQLPDLIAYMVTDLMDVTNIVPDASMEEIMNYFMIHIASKTSHERMSWEIGVCLHMKSYPGGFLEFSKFVENFDESWFFCMDVYPLSEVDGFMLLDECFDSMPTAFCKHIRNFISHPELHQMSEKQAEALVMFRASYFLYLVARDMSLRIPKNIREGNTPRPVALPPSPANVYAVNSYTTAQICM